MTLSPDAAEIIRRKKTEYCRFADTNQFHLFDRIALPDATFRFAGPDGNILNENGIVYSWENRQTFCDAFTEALASVQCVSILGSGCLSFLCCLYGAFASSRTRTNRSPQTSPLEFPVCPCKSEPLTIS